MCRQSETRAGNRRCMTNASPRTQANNAAASHKQLPSNHAAVHASKQDTAQTSHRTLCHQGTMHRQGSTAPTAGATGTRSYIAVVESGLGAGGRRVAFRAPCCLSGAGVFLAPPWWMWARCHGCFFLSCQVEVSCCLSRCASSCWGQCVALFPPLQCALGASCCFRLVWALLACLCSGPWLAYIGL